LPEADFVTDSAGNTTINDLAKTSGASPPEEAQVYNEQVQAWVSPDIAIVLATITDKIKKGQPLTPEEMKVRLSYNSPTWGPPTPTEPRHHAEPKHFKTLAEFAQEREPLDYVVDPVIAAGSLYTFTAKTGDGKTGVLITITVAVSSGHQAMLPEHIITPGRVAYCTCENPDNFRDRLLTTCFAEGIDPASLGNNYLVLDAFDTPEHIVAALKKHSKDGPFRMIVIDTLQAYFAGESENANAKLMEFLRSVRPLTKLEGRPAVVIAAHPKKNATSSELVPYGAGAILNEVDGNLVQTRPAEDQFEMSWQGKFRGCDFKPLHFGLKLATCPAVVNSKGVELLQPVFGYIKEAEAAEAETNEGITQLGVLEYIHRHPGETQTAIRQRLNLSKGTASRWLKDLKAAHWIAETVTGGWRITRAGKTEIAAEGGAPTLGPDGEL